MIKTALVKKKTVVKKVAVTFAGVIPTAQELDRALKAIDKNLFLNSRSFDRFEVNYGHHNTIVEFTFTPEQDVFCCGVEVFGDFRIEEDGMRDEYAMHETWDLTKGQETALRKLYPKILTFQMATAVNVYKHSRSSGFSSSEKAVTFTDNGDSPSVDYGKAAIKTGLFKKVKTFINSNSGNEVTYYISK